MQKTNKNTHEYLNLKKSYLISQSKLHNFLFNNVGLILIFFTTVVFHIIAYVSVKSHYSQHLPHYDSIGTYTGTFQVINTYFQEGFSAALKLASSFHTSWLQSYFALLGAPFLNTTPESMQIINTLTVFLFMLSVFLAAQSAGAGKLKSYLISLIVFLPDVFYSWKGGLLDLQRDTSFVLLLGATYFLFFAQVWRPSLKKSMLLGVTAGLTVFSRGNALFLLIAIMAPIIGIWVLWKLYSKDLRAIFKNLLPAIIVFCLIAGPNLYYTLSLTTSRYLNPFVAYGIGDDPWISFTSHWYKPILIMFGLVGEYGGHAHGTMFLTLGGVFLFMIFLAVLNYKQIIKFNYSSIKSTLLERRNIVMILAGSWSIAITIFLMCFVIKLRPLGYGDTKLPFYPSLIGFLTFFFITGLSIHLNVKVAKAWKYVLSVLLCVGVLLLGGARLKLQTPESTPKYVKLAKEMANFFESTDKPKVIAFIWHDVINLDTIKYYSAQKGSRLPRKFYYTTPDGRNLLDFAVAIPHDVDIPAVLSSMKEQIERNADFIVLCTKPNAYAIKHHMFIFQYGQPVVDSFIKSNRYRVVFTYDLWRIPFVVLENTERVKKEGINGPYFGNYTCLQI